MNRETVQRKEEIEQVAGFFNLHFGYIPDFENLPTNSRPDVCVHFEGMRVGIELTRAVDSSRAVFDTFRQSMLLGARRRFSELEGHAGMVTVSMLPKFDPKASNGYDLGVQLAEDIAQHWTAPHDFTIFERHHLSAEVAQVVSGARAFPVEGAKATEWHAPVAAWVQGITNERLQPIINSKVDDLAAYRKMGCDEYWLLIYARVGKAAEIFDAAHGFESTSLVSPFDRTYFYDGWRSLPLASTPLQSR